MAASIEGRVPRVADAESYLRAAADRVPGPWVAHSRHVAGAARLIAEAHPDLDPHLACALGLLHDIGRRSGSAVPDVRHVLEGYYFMRDEGFDGAARICLTHSFPVKDVDAFASPWECPPAEREMVQRFLDGVEYTAYDRLIQLCDCLALPEGYCLVEKRFVDVALRRGFNALTLTKWRAFLEVKREMDEAVGGSIYRLLPGVVEHTFGFDGPASSGSARP